MNKSSTYEILQKKFWGLKRAEFKRKQSKDALKEVLNYF